MPAKGKLPEWERLDNRTIIFTKVLDKSQTFTELLSDTGFSRSTLTNHLKLLQEEGLLEKSLSGGRVVYRTTLDEERIETELKKTSYDFLIKLIDGMAPGIGVFLQMLMMWGIKACVLEKRRKIEGKPPLTHEEFLDVSPRLVAEGLIQIGVDPDQLNNLREVFDLLEKDILTDEWRTDNE